MALFRECMPQCARNALDSADIVRDGDISTTVRVHCAILTIFPFAACRIIMSSNAKKSALTKVQAIPYPPLGLRPGAKCQLSTGLPRTEPHRDRRLIATD
jgi:hypothetical protein